MRILNNTLNCGVRAFPLAALSTHPFHLVDVVLTVIIAGKLCYATKNGKVLLLSYSNIEHSIEVPRQRFLLEDFRSTLFNIWFSAA